MKAFKAPIAVARRLYATAPMTTKITLPNGLSYTQPTGLYINNEFVPSHAGKTFAVISPSTEEEVAQVYEADHADVDVAVKAAQEAFDGGWNGADPLVRAIALNKIADILQENRELFASIEAFDNGKSLNNARGDIDLSIGCFRSLAGFADKILGNVVETGDSHFNYTRREPLGVCGQIIPWNFPLLMFTWKVAPALCTNNTIVLKTSETTPLLALYLCLLLKEQDVLPKGVLNVVNGFGKVTGNAITEHPGIKKVAFTGSTATGKHIMAKCASTVKKVTLELGGKSPHIIFDDADIPVAVANVINGIFYNSGEVCSAGLRLYVQEGIHDEFMEAFVAAASQVKVGNPFDEEVFQGAQNSKVQMEKILKYIEAGKAEGAKVLLGGERMEGKGYYVQPTIFGNVREDMKIVKEEIFGPVVTVLKFKTLDEVVKLANDTEYGLAAGVQTTNVNTAHIVARRLRAGTVWVNTYNDYHPMVPFGGFGASGVGREMGEEALANYTQAKAVRMALH